MKMNNVMQEFNKNGFLVLRKIIPSARIEEMHRAALDQSNNPVEPYELESSLGYPGAPLPNSPEGKITIRRLRNAYLRHDLWRRWAHDRTLLHYICSVLGSRDVSLTQAHHNCLMTKAPKMSSFTGWHQDIRYWSFESPILVTAWLSLTDEHQKNGCLQVIPGSHCKLLRKHQFDEQQFFRNDLTENQAMIHNAKLIESSPGDLILFDSRLLHSAHKNLTNEIKLSLVFTYKLTENRAIEGTRSSSMDEINMNNEITLP